MSVLLEVRNLTTVFPLASGDARVVDGMSYQVDAGRSLAIVGESGCGKTISALSLMGLVPAPGKIADGQLLFRKRDLVKLPEAELRAIRGREIGMIFQDPMTSLNPVLTVGDQLMEALLWHGQISAREARTQVVETLDLVGIADARGRLADYPHQFSGGQRQRIMIAMAVVCRPALLIADEPTTALDVTIQAQIIELIDELRKALGMAVIWITHDLALAGGIVDDVAVMYAGRIVEYGPVSNVFANPQHPYTAGLLESIPRFDEPRQQHLASIDGSPPDLARLPAGCAFAPRCARRIERCKSELPLLDETIAVQRAACWRAGQP